MTDPRLWRNTEAGKAYNRAWKKAHPLYNRAWKKAHPLTVEQRKKATAGNRRYYLANKAKVHATGRPSKAAAVKIRYALLYNLKSKPCLDCGGSFPPYVMDFDHRPGETKLFDMRGMVHRNLKSALTEIAKCDVVCANCHRLRTQRRFDETQ